MVVEVTYRVYKSFLAKFLVSQHKIQPPKINSKTSLIMIIGFLSSERHQCFYFFAVSIYDECW